MYDILPAGKAQYNFVLFHYMKTILVTEDETAIRDLLATMFGRWGYRVLEAADAPSAIEILKSGVQIDLVMTDELMPGPPGWEVVAASKRLAPERPIIMCSGTATQMQCNEAGVDNLISKPFSPKVLRDLIEQCLKIVTINDLHALQMDVESNFPIQDNDEGTWQFFRGYGALLKALESTMAEEMKLSLGELAKLPAGAELGPQSRALFSAVAKFVESARK